eukprot:gene4869-6071_t
MLSRSICRQIRTIGSLNQPLSSKSTFRINNILINPLIINNNRYCSSSSTTDKNDDESPIITADSTTSTKVETETTPKRGRPRKEPSNEPKKPRGRPKKDTTSTTTTESNTTTVNSNVVSEQKQPQQEQQQKQKNIPSPESVSALLQFKKRVQAMKNMDGSSLSSIINQIADKGAGATGIILIPPQNANNNDKSDGGKTSSKSKEDQGYNSAYYNIVDLLNEKATKTPRFQLSEDLIVEDDMLPRDIVKELDKYVIGQDDAKRAVAVALRNRWRRKRLDSSISKDVYPKNILMIGPTGVGKTEIARRLAKMVNAPFIKVEATKYTEVGFHGPDVDTIIRDLVEIAIQNIKQQITASQKDLIESDIEKAIIQTLLGSQFQSKSYEELLKLLRDKQLEKVTIEIDVPAETKQIELEDFSAPFAKLLTNLASTVDQQKTQQSKKKTVTVAEARSTLEKVYKEKLVVNYDAASLTKLAIKQVEQSGIVFLDEVDKICTPRDSVRSGGDASSDGVQRDLLPIIEGCDINTKYGVVDTSRILFIASGAFHSNKPSDLMSEFQGRLPIRVELKPLSQEDFYRILTEPTNNQIQQQQALLKTEGIEIQFTEETLKEVAKIAYEANAQVQNIGARRLHGIIERIIEDISFNCDNHKGSSVIVGVEDVKKHLSDLLIKTDLSKYII